MTYIASYANIPYVSQGQPLTYVFLKNTYVGYSRCKDD